jgi:hypothetical protein
MRQIEKNDRSADVEEKEGRREKEERRERGRYLYCCLQRVNACYDSLYPEA